MVKRVERHILKNPPPAIEEICHKAKNLYNYVNYQMGKRKRVGIFGWGLVAPKSSNIEAFRKNLENADSWLQPFEGFGPSNFLVGEPEFDFQIRFQQAVNHILVDKTKVLMMINENGDILSIQIQVYPKLVLPDTPQIDKEAALAIGRTSVLRGVGNIIKERAEPIILVDGGSARLAWRCLIYPEGHKPVLLDIAADDGTIIQEHEMVEYASISGNVQFHYYKDPQGWNNSFTEVQKPGEFLQFEAYNTSGSLVHQQTIYGGNPSYSWSPSVPGVYTVLFYRNDTYAYVKLSENLSIRCGI